ncbi:Putative signal peptide peptidase SppA [Anaerohalosphaera lusitana]|uniref:Putative signal peptide peptidase SppA n=1 Tax=Anaerohalosphaera lusitana TaxID=1936003 RepID=A0A1U9NL41_9BACT|nr:signal peptide peptidase SppA [Anaerohalosphaera lusitana]AQT68653.1 Putative signal peptide peptidase SppA [Anaerohalosphaera lusitana]
MEHDNNNGNPPREDGNDQPPVNPHANPAQPIYIQMPEQKDKRSGWRVLWRLLFTVSIVLNIFLFLLVIGISVMYVPAAGGMVREELVREGDAQNKIAIVRLEGMITTETSDMFRNKINAVRNDDTVKAVIVRTITPGGAVSSSDQIYHMIRQLKAEKDIPVIAFMQTVAASGGYYTSVACDHIMAEPTVITGSIGVIMNHFVLKDLLEQKLGVDSVVVKSGEKKDWPSMFSQPSEEQKEYLREKLIKPSYERFVSLVAEGRSHVLSEEEVLELADGSIYTAEEALEKKLVDSVGYVDSAIQKAQEMAGISGARVVEYKRPITFMSVLGASNKTPWDLDPEMVHELTTPKLMYLWDGQN